jgi:hypothetical protein
MTLLVVLVYLLAIGIPVFLLYRFRSQSWYWHALAIAVALCLGFVPTPPSLKSAVFDLLIGSVFLLLMVWGVGGLIVFRPHRERHA